MGRIEILTAIYFLQLLKLSTGAHFQPEIRNFLLMNLNSLFGKTPITSFEMQLFNRDFWGFFIKSKIQNHMSLYYHKPKFIFQCWNFKFLQISKKISVMFQNAPANPHIFLEKSVPPPRGEDSETYPKGTCFRIPP